MIELENITKTYQVAGKQVHGLKGVSLTISAGEFVSIMGPSGSGKSTLSSILGCLAASTTGHYKLDGQLVTQMSPNQLAELRNGLIGFIFQDFSLLDGLSVLENISLPLVYARVGYRERKKRAEQKLAQVGLSHKATHYPNQLSGGQKQRVAIARALVTNPALIFADEPTGALDRRTGNEIMGILQDLNMQGQTIVQVTHSQEHANYSKRILYIVDGLVVRDELVARPILARSIASEMSSSEDEIITRLWRIACFAPHSESLNVQAMMKLYELSRDPSCLIQAAKTTCQWNVPETTRMIDELLQNVEPTVREETLRQLEKKNIEFSMPYWWKAALDENAWVRFLAVSMIKRYLKNWGELECSAIVNLQGDSDERVRATVAMMVGSWKDVKYESALIALANDPDNRVRANAIEALGNLGMPISQQRKECLRKCLSDSNNRGRANAALSFHFIEPETSKKVLFEMLQAANNLMRASAAWAIGKLLVDDGGELLMKKLLSEKNELVVGQIILSLGAYSQDKYPFYRQVADCSVKDVENPTDLAAA